MSGEQWAVAVTLGTAVVVNGSHEQAQETRDKLVSHIKDTLSNAGISVKIDSVRILAYPPKEVSHNSN